MPDQNVDLIPDFASETSHLVLTKSTINTPVLSGFSRYIERGTKMCQDSSQIQNKS